MDIDTVKKIIVKKYPYLLIDKIVDFQTGDSITALKNITSSDFFFGDKSDYTVPGSILMEIMAQVAIAGIYASGNEEKNVTLAGMSNFRIKANAVPGDSLIITAQISRLRISSGEVRCEIFAESEKICEANLIFSFE